MKAILISIKPKWCALMMNGIKKIEVRKGTALYKATQKLIEENGYAEFYVYCTKDSELDLVDYRGTACYGDFRLITKGKKLTTDDNQPRLNGKVLFKFRCYKVEEIYIKYGKGWVMGEKNVDTIEKETCLTIFQLFDYIGGKGGYAWHISNLEIFDKPKELSEFKKCYRSKGYPQNQSWYLTKAPQSFCFIEVEQ